MRPKNIFIVLEGIEGAGKTTQLSLLADFFAEQGHVVVTSREPGGTIVGERIRQILLDQTHTDMHADTELLLMFAARAQNYHEIIAPALSAGKTVICDRFVASSYAYQGGGRGIAMPRIATLYHWTLGDVSPDLVLLFDIDPVEGLRRTGRRALFDRFETEQLSFFSAVRGAYLALAQEYPDIFRIIDAEQPVHVIQNQIQQIVRYLLA